jgi:hypothetical protein
MDLGYLAAFALGFVASVAKDYIQQRIFIKHHDLIVKNDQVWMDAAEDERIEDEEDLKEKEKRENEQRGFFG